MSLLLLFSGSAQSAVEDPGTEPAEPVDPFSMDAGLIFAPHMQDGTVVGGNLVKGSVFAVHSVNSILEE